MTTEEIGRERRTGKDCEGLRVKELAGRVEGDGGMGGIGGMEREREGRREGGREVEMLGEGEGRRDGVPDTCDVTGHVFQFRLQIGDFFLHLVQAVFQGLDVLCP